jgi:choline dehydrogenase
VTRLLFEGTRTVGVEYLHSGMLHQVRVDSHSERLRQREVILSAGSFDSPKLLMLSGIGDAAQLQTMEIPVVVDLPGVGQNLQDHLLVAVRYEATQDLHPATTSNGFEAGLYSRSRRSRFIIG